ncbi:MAG: hypothetical protein A2X42_11120 [Candidatus Margulisbacteria bacterium GWF2_38_17]|nr:MAG: hypothetical protein A2X42_11120 [Candidatus Margulisbacteria bacterium GWF2_38_17]OGI05997.1 MAG: hypothetical protein A2X41_12295 [Candidatus Margulisbacteria bacterium GWE2_39_32]
MKALLSIAYYTLLQNMRHKIFLISIGAGTFLIIFSILAGEMAVGEQTRFILDFSMAITQVLSLFLAIIIGSYQTREEIDKGTVSLIITKPISRSLYLLGKFSGGALSVLFNILCMGVLSLAVFYFQKVPISIPYMLSLYLIFIESLIVLAFAMFFSLISSSIIATMATFGTTIIGHFSRDFFLLSQKGHGLARIFGKTSYILLPNLEKFNIKTMVIYSTSPSLNYMLMVTLYALFFMTMVMVLNKIILDKLDIQ